MIRCLGWAAVLLLPALGARAQEEKASIEVILEEGTNFSLSLSPDESRLVIDLQGTLWLLPVEGGEAQGLTDGLGDDRLPDWSPDGETIVFQSFRNGTWDIWSVAADGTNLVPLTKGPFDDREPVWSPDGRAIAFSSDRSGNYDLWVLDIESGMTSRVTENSANDSMPAWSPDSAFLAFVSDRGNRGEAELVKIHVVDGIEAPIASFEGEVSSPSWSGDGQSIVLRHVEQQARTMMGTRFDEGMRSDLLSVPMEGGEPTPLSAGEDVFPFRVSWAGKGDICYTSDGKIRRLTSEGEIHVIPFQAKVQLDRAGYRRRSFEDPEPGEIIPARGIVRPVVSPDGSKLAFTALGDIWVVPAAGGVPTPLTRDEFLDSDPSWSPDGKFVVYASDRSGTMDLWVKDVESSPRSGERRLTAGAGAEFSPAWSPDGNDVAFLDERYQLRIVSAVAGEVPRVVYETKRWAGLPSWSADSRHVTMAVHEPFSTRFREGFNRILVVSVESGESRLLELPERGFGSRDGDGPVWSPDGRKMAFALDGGLWVLPVTLGGQPDGPLERVVDEAVDFPSWYPDSKSLIYIATDSMKKVALGEGSPEKIPVHLEYQVPANSAKMLIRGARLIDGTGAPPQDNMDILIEGNRIQSVEPGGTEPEEDVRIIDASGKTILPGLIESHTHLSLPAWGSRHGKVWLAYGVTSIRTASAPIFRILEEKESILAGRRIGPRIFFTGFSFDGDRVYYPGSLAIESEEELDRELGRAFGLDFDLVKTYVRLPDALQEKVVTQAHDRGIPVTSHELYPAVAYGVDGIEHIWGTSRRGFSPKVTELRRSYQDVVELISKSGVYFTPTVLIMGGFDAVQKHEPELLRDARHSNLFPPWALFQESPSPTSEVGDRREILRPYLDTIKRISSGGGNVLAGTDSPIVPYGLSLILEVELLSEAGLGPLEAIRSATQLAARALGAERDLGTIEPGKLADLVILSDDPSRDIKNLRTTQMVVLNGRLVTLGQLLRAGSN